MPDDIPKIPRHRGKKNKPKDTAWKQQKLPAFRPHYNISSVIPVIFFIGITILSIGIALYFGHINSLEQSIDYTDCVLTNGTQISNLVQIGNSSLQCSYTINLDQSYTGDVKFYYGLTKYFQNNRLYFNSRNDQQLRGDLDQTDGCEPLKYVKQDDTKIPIVPCGVVANSMFNDTFQLYFIIDNTTTVKVPWTTRGVLGSIEKKRKFSNPLRQENQTLCDVFQGTIRPPSWRQDICKLGIDNPEDGVGLENIDFMVWMKVAALPNFRKHYRNLDRQVDMFSSGLPAGQYNLIITYNYPVDMYNGRKLFIITRENWVGPRNLFLPVVYLVVGIFLLLVTVVFLLIWLKQRLNRRSEDNPQ